MNVVGIMSGTSLDGVDFVLTKVHRDQMKIEFSDMASTGFPRTLRERLQAAVDHRLTVDTLAELHFDLGRFYAREFQKIQKKKNWSVELMGLHGQTVYHRGSQATLQIGEPSFLAELTGVPVVADFRPSDIAAGGQGAPLAPLFHAAAFSGSANDFAVHNLGGISNLTLFQNRQITLAFDTGPANMPIDFCMQLRTQGRLKYDVGGKLARKGRINDSLVREGLKHPYFKKKAPKSCGREEFGEKWIKALLKNFKKLEDRDLIASITELVAQSIAGAYLQHVKSLPAEIIFCGGGAKNTFLLERVQAHLPEVNVVTSEQRGWSSQAIEGAAFAFLAAARIWEMRLDYGSSTGASRPIQLGKLVEL